MSRHLHVKVGRRHRDLYEEARREQERHYRQGVFVPIFDLMLDIRDRRRGIKNKRKYEGFAL